MLRAENLTCMRSGRVVLDALDFHVAESEIVALVGDTGAGKSTVLECFLGSHALRSGRACVDDIDAARSPHIATSLVACVPAQLSFPANARVLSHVRNTCTLHGRRVPDPVLRATLLRGGIEDSWHERPIGDCPPSVQRKLGLTLAALKNVRAFLLDDPSRDLAAADVDALVVSLRRMRKAGAAILLATRELAFAQRLATRVVLLERGAVVETFDPNAPHLASEANTYLSALIA